MYYILKVLLYQNLYIYNVNIDFKIFSKCKLYHILVKINKNVISLYSNDDANEAQGEIEENCLRAAKKNKMMEASEIKRKDKIRLRLSLKGTKLDT